MRTGPGHVGPFATLGVVLYVLWLLAFGAVAAGHPRVARRLLVGVVVSALVMAPGQALLVAEALVGSVAGLAPGGSVHRWHQVNTPPGIMLVVLLPLAPLACLAPLRFSAAGRLGLLAATAAATAVLLATAAPRGITVRQWHTDPSYAFYRGAEAGISNWWSGVPLVLTLAVLAALAARRWRREWLPAVVLFSLAFTLLRPLPYALWLTLADGWRALGGPEPGAAGWLIAPATLLVLAVAVGHRWRVGRPARGTARSAEVTS